MNLLVTNIREEQPYLILRCLRHEARRIVVTVDEGNLFRRWSGMSAWSRHVNKRYTVPDCSADWQAGRIEPDNTPAEETYVRRIEQICRTENIDTIFPSYDAEVFVFAKNKERFSRQGITTVTPEYSAIARLLDKSLTLQAAQKVGFPIPLSHTPSNREELHSAVAGLAAPWVLKPRCNAHGANICLTNDIVELEKMFTRLNSIQERPLLQEFITAQTKRNYYLLVSPELEVVSLFSPRVHRTRRISVRAPCAAVETTREVPFTREIRALVRELGAWGAMTVQTIVDERDGMPRLMEINPRFGHNLWYRTEMGINEPLIYLRLAQGRPAGDIPSFSEGVLLVDPLWDTLHLLGQCLDQGKTWLRTRFRNAESVPTTFEADSIPQLLRAFKAEYFSRRPRVTSPLNRGYFSDPLPPLVRILRTLLEAVGRRLS